MNAERYWQSHEVLEGPWRQRGSDFFHGLILYASAFVHVLRGNAHGVVAQLDKAEMRLWGYRPFYLGIDVDALLAHVDRCRGLVKGCEGAPTEDWTGRVPLPQLRLEPDKVRGDEPELKA